MQRFFALLTLAAFAAATPSAFAQGAAKPEDTSKATPATPVESTDTPKPHYGSKHKAKHQKDSGTPQGDAQGQAK